MSSRATRRRRSSACARASTGAALAPWLRACPQPCAAAAHLSRAARPFPLTLRGRPDLEPDELFEVLSQCLLSGVDRDCLAGWGATVYIMCALRRGCCPCPLPAPDAQVSACLARSRDAARCLRACAGLRRACARLTSRGGWTRQRGAQRNVNVEAPSGMRSRAWLGLAGDAQTGVSAGGACMSWLTLQTSDNNGLMSTRWRCNYGATVYSLWNKKYSD